MGTTNSWLTTERWSAAQARAALEAWRASGLSMHVFERRNGLANRRLRWWANRLGNVTAELGEARLVPVVVKSAPPPVLVHVKGGVTIEVVDATQAPAIWVAAVARELARC